MLAVHICFSEACLPEAHAGPGPLLLSLAWRIRWSKGISHTTHFTCSWERALTSLMEGHAFPRKWLGSRRLTFLQFSFQQFLRISFILVHSCPFCKTCLAPCHSHSEVACVTL